jgi:hypothetical protein
VLGLFLDRFDVHFHEIAVVRKYKLGRQAVDNGIMDQLAAIAKL